MKELKLKVNGMHCTGCENRIISALKNEKNIKKVKANHQTKEVFIEFKKETNEKDEENIINSLTELGFEIEKNN